MMSAEIVSARGKKPGGGGGAAIVARILDASKSYRGQHERTELKSGTERREEKPFVSRDPRFERGS